MHKSRVLAGTDHYHFRRELGRHAESHNSVGGIIGCNVGAQAERIASDYRSGLTIQYDNIVRNEKDSGVVLILPILSKNGERGAVVPDTGDCAGEVKVIEYFMRLRFALLQAEKE